MEYHDSRGFPVEYAVLGFLCEGPLHGYDLRRRISEGLGSVWRVAMSQLYSVLHRLEERGWVESTVLPQQSRPDRRVHTVTEEGSRAFRKWAASPVVRFRELRVVFLAKIYFLRRVDPAGVASLVDAQIAELERALQSLGHRGAVKSDDPSLEAAVVSFRRGQIAGAVAWLRENRESLGQAKEAR